MSRANDSFFTGCKMIIHRMKINSFEQFLIHKIDKFGFLVWVRIYLCSCQWKNPGNRTITSWKFVLYSGSCSNSSCRHCRYRHTCGVAGIRHQRVESRHWKKVEIQSVGTCGWCPYWPFLQLGTDFPISFFLKFYSLFIVHKFFFIDFFFNYSIF